MRLLWSTVYEKKTKILITVYFIFKTLQITVYTKGTAIN